MAVAVKNMEPDRGSLQKETGPNQDPETSGSMWLLVNRVILPWQMETWAKTCGPYPGG